MNGQRQKSEYTGGRDFKAYGSKRFAFRSERKMCRLDAERIEDGKEFQIVGAAKEKDRRPADDFSKGTVSRSLSDERRWRVGVYGTINEFRYDGDCL